MIDCSKIHEKIDKVIKKENHFEIVYHGKNRLFLFKYNLLTNYIDERGLDNYVDINDSYFYIFKKFESKGEIK